MPSLALHIRQRRACGADDEPSFEQVLNPVLKVGNFWKAEVGKFS
jgi:hypothetical protein